MKIKLAILESDQSYLNRIVSVFSTKYADKFQIYSFTDPQIAISEIDKEKIDVLISNDAFEIDPTALPKRCSFAYFVDSMDVDTINGQCAICKFQKAELIYKRILSIFSENAGSFADLKLTDDDCIIYTFSSPCGGTGTSSVAAACAMRFAAQGKRVLFLPLNNFDSSDLFFSGEGQFGMSDVIFSLKSKKANIAMKLESYVKQDASGVFFFSEPKFALDMLELKHEEKKQLITELKISGSYNYIILDIDFGLDKQHLDFYGKSHGVVMVGDGSEVSNLKIKRAYDAIVMMDQNSDIVLSNRFSLIYNRFSSKTGKTIMNTDIRNVGGAPIYANATGTQITKQLMMMDMFDKLG